MPCTRWARTKRSPGWPPASSDSSCPTSSISSRSSSRSPPSRRRATAPQALEHLAQIFENRRQYPKAADYWQRLLKEYPNEARPERRRTGSSGSSRSSATGAASSRCMTQPAGRGATVEYRFRNGKQVDFEAHEIKVDKLLDDVKAYLKIAAPASSTGRRSTSATSAIGWCTENQQQYLGQQVAQWQIGRQAAAGAFRQAGDRDHAAAKGGGLSARRPRWSAATPATSSSGSTTRRSSRSRWPEDLLLRGRRRHGPADRQGQRRVLRLAATLASTISRSYEVVTKQFAEFTDADGQVDARSQPAGRQQLPVADHRPNHAKGRFAYLGFTGVWYGQLVRRRVQRAPRSTRSPTGRSIGPIRR